MKKILYLFSILVILNFSCGQGGSGGGDNGRSVSETTPVTIVFGEAETGLNASAAITTAASTRELTLCRFTITGPDMDKIVEEKIIAGRDTLTETFNVPSGPNREFLVEFIDNTGAVLLKTSQLADLTGVPKEIKMPEPQCTGICLEPPVFDGVLNVTNSERASVRLQWGEAVDAVTPPERIQYAAYIALNSIGDRISDDQVSAFENEYHVGDCAGLKCDGQILYDCGDDTLSQTRCSGDIISMLFDYEGLVLDTQTQTGILTPGETYYFIVRAKDRWDNFDTNFIEKEVMVYNLTVDKTGSGTVTSVPPGIECGDDCTEDYLSGTQVTLMAEPDQGGEFQGWSGGICSGMGDCTITLDGVGPETSVSPSFLCLDGDGDGYTVCEDCDDSNPNTYPGAEDFCDGIDNDCDGTVDNGYVCGGLADVTVDSNDITLSVWDSGALIDGDQIDLIVNGEYVLTDHVLTAAAFAVNVTVNEGNNTLVVHADNEGGSPPNTAAIEISNVIDGDSIQEWSLSTGESTSMNIMGPHNPCPDADGDSYTICENDCNDANAMINPGAVEVCNGIDDNCDGATDPGCACSDGQTRTCGTDEGACQSGTETCVNGQWSGECAGEIGPADEVCDGLDNDCDGSIDENLTRQTTCGVGECAGNTGTETCTNGDWGNNTCDPLAGATTEICDGLDNDCDGSADETFTDLGNNCSEGVGECQDSGIRVCDTNGTGTTCNATPGSPTTEICDGLDNDCDGSTDENLTRQTTCGVGECAGNTGTETCSNGDWSNNTCDPLVGSIPEGPFGDPTCGDTLDNDCDGLTDANDPDCEQAVDCTIYMNKKDCNNEPVCRWRDKQCVPR